MSRLIQNLLLWLWRCDQRGLFLYWSGRQWRTIDAMACLRAFYDLPGFDWDTDPSLTQDTSSQVQLAGVSKICGAVRRVFTVDVLTESECSNLFWAFKAHCDDVKKNTSLFPTSQDSTVSTPWGDLPEPAPLPSVSGSTQDEPSPEPLGSPAVVTSG